MVISLPPPTRRQTILLALLLVVPIVVAAVTVASLGAGNTEDLVTAWVLAALGVVLLAMVCGSMLGRRSLTIGDDAIVVRHSLYTLRIERADAGALRVTPLRDMAWLATAYRRLGTAAFGYLSGWFRLSMAADGFCAVSQGPLYQVDFQRGGRPAVLVLSCDSATADQITRWAS